MRLAEEIQLSEEEIRRLNWILLRRSCSKKLTERAQIVLLAHEGLSNVEIAKSMNITRQKVARWRQRYLRLGLDGIEKDATRPGRMPELEKTLIDQVIYLSNFEKPRNSEVWTQQALANEVGVSASSVARIWKKMGFNPKQEKK